MDPIYLDNNATTRPADQVVAAAHDALERTWANPSSVHRPGQMARQAMELARSEVAKLVGCRDRDLIFTSGGTEANNLAIRGGGHFDTLITTRVEHAAVREPVERLASDGMRVAYLPTDIDGRIDGESLADALADTAGNVLIAVQWANNETGVIQPIAELVERVNAHRDSGGNVLLHVDATQAVGKLPVNFRGAGVDMATFAAHKFHGVKGCGALYVRRGVKLRAQIVGGPQERDRRGGTENTAGIIAMGQAAILARQWLEDPSNAQAIAALRDRLEQCIIEQLPDAQINGARLTTTRRLWNTTNIGFPKLEAEAILISLSERGVCASAGAACSSGSLDPSPVLLAMGVPPQVAHGSVRFSLSRETTGEQIDRALTIVPQVVRKLARTLPASV
jgi:cysteine desulfurase